MVRKLLSLFILLVISSVIRAQLYNPLLDSVNRWYYMINTEYVITNPQTQSLMPCNYGWGSGTPMWFEEYTAGDTMINNLTYRIMVQQSMMGDCLYGFIREDTLTERVYFQDVNFSPEVLLYDFLFQLGDTITLNFMSPGSYFQSGLYTVTSISSFALHTGTRRMLNLTCSSCTGSNAISWIEGLGNLGGVAYTYTGNQFGGSHVLMCPGYPHNYIQVMTCAEHNYKFYMDSCARQASENDNCMLYQDSCHYRGNCGGVQELSSLASFSVFPLPAKTSIIVKLEILNTDEFDLIFHDITGKEVKNIHLGKQQSGNFSMTIDLASFSDGSYIVECKSKKGSVYRKLVVQK